MKPPRWSGATGERPMSLDLTLMQAVSYGDESELCTVREFLAEHGDALENAAERLGGARRALRWRAFIGEIAAARHLTAGHCSALVDMHRLLSLDGVEIPDSEQSARFATIDPTDPVVHYLCLLADTLGRLLDEISDMPARCVAPKWHDSDLLPVF